MTTGLPQQRSCGTMGVHYQLLTTDIAYAVNRREIENRALERAIAFANGDIAVARSGITTVPVVVHVVYNASRPEQNISEAQIRSQIDVLNRDFRKQNPDIASIPAPFQSLADDARIEFVLASTDPNGNPTNGIIRTVTNAAGFGADDQVKSAATGGVDPWPTDRYLNIWVCLLTGGLLGYAQFPGGPAATDGVVITHTGFGTTGTAAAPFNLGRTTTHEIGHWLNLRHIWGDDGNGCNGSDFVDDTPNQAGPNSGQPSFPRVTCNNGPNGDMFMNYMDYTDDAGMFMFTTGQVVRMQSVLDNERASLGTTPIPTARQGEFYTSDGSGNLSPLNLAAHRSWQLRRQ
jgi:Pregnancy-associated plasma protein-A